MSEFAIEAIDHRDAGRAIRALAIPSALAFLSDQLLGIVDTIAVGSLGTAALAGITVASSVFLVFGIGLFAFGSGLRIIGAQAIGGGRSERFGLIVRSSSIVPLAIALITAVAFGFAAAPLMHAMLPRSVPFVAAAQYLALRCWCLVPMALTGQLIVAFATAGDTRLGFRVLVAINAIHLPALLVLALGVGTHRPFGLAGAGVSSLISEIAGLAYAMYATRRRPEFGIFASWRIDRALVRATSALSWPEFVFLTLQILPEPIAIALLAPSGAPVVAAFRALALVNDATWALPGSIGDACEVIVGQRIGAGDYFGAKAFQERSVRLGVATCAIVGLIVAALAWPLAALFTLDPALASVAALPLAVHVGISLPLKGFAMTMLAPIRASGDVRWVMLMGIATTAIAIAGITTGIVIFKFGLWSMPFGWISAWIFRNMITTLRLRSGDWERRKLT